MAETPIRYRLELLKVGDRQDIREVRLLRDALHEAPPLPVVILAGLVDQDDVNTTKRRRRCPLHLLVRAFPLIPQNSVNGINLDVLDTLHVGQLRLERVDQLTRGAYDEDTEASLRAADGHLQQHRRFAGARPARYEETALVLALLLFVVQGYCVGHSAQGLLLSRRPGPADILRPVDTIPLVPEHVILSLVHAVADADLEKQAGVLLAPEHTNQ